MGSTCFGRGNGKLKSLILIVAISIFVNMHYLCKQNIHYYAVGQTLLGSFFNFNLHGCWIFALSQKHGKFNFFLKLDLN